MYFFIYRFIGLCLRFAEDFETSLDDWKPNMNDNSIMNLCVVSEGTYEVCSRTIAQKQDKNGISSKLDITEKYFIQHYNLIFIIFSKVKFQKMQSGY